MRLVLRLVFLHVSALNSLLLASCLPFAIWIECSTVMFHVWHFIITCLCDISVAPYSQNQTSIKISTSSHQNSESFVKKAVISVMSKLRFHRYLIYIKGYGKNLLDASVVLIQTVIRLPEIRSTLYVYPYTFVLIPTNIFIN